MKISNIKNNHYLSEIFLTYQCKDYLLAHLYEHLIYRQLINQGSIKIEWCDIGSGIINIRFKCHKKYLNLNFVEQILNLNKIDENNFLLEKERLNSELLEKINDQTKIFYEAIHHKIFNYKKLLEKNKKVSNLKLESIRKFVKNIKSKNTIIIFAGPNFNDNYLLQLRSDGGHLSVKKKTKSTKLNLQIRQDNNNYSEINFKIHTKNNHEAHLISMLANLVNKQLEPELSKIGTYQIKNHLYKDYHKYIYLGLSFFSHVNQKAKISKELINIIKNPDHITKEKLFSEKKDLVKILNNIKNKKLNMAVDYIWQKLEWNNYIDPKKEIKRNNLLTPKKLISW